MKKLRAGALVVGYENGFLRRIMYGETEVLRMIYFASRDHNWNTLNHEVQNEVISEGDHSFEITYDCKHREGTEVVIEWKVRISGAADGTISFKITGSPVRSFRKNRVGFCLLHPRSIAGSGCRIIDPEGKAHDTAFPEVIARDNPFTRVQSMEWSAAETPFRVDFEGDVFETEDQRNWGDASFKTFCTPLDRPFPVEIDAGGAIAQQIIFKPLHPLGSVGHSTKRVELFPSAFAGFMPWVGINAPASATDKLSDAAVVLLRALRLHHYRLDLSPSEPDWVSAFSSGYETAYGLGLPLEVALHLSENFAEEIEAFSVLCQQNKVRLRTVMLMRKDAHITDQRVTSLIPGLKVLFRNVAFGVGTNHNFTEINRNPIDATHADFICFAMDPQEHAADQTTIIENGEGLQDLIRSTRAMYGPDKEVYLSPLALRRRFNPYASNPKDIPVPLALQSDPRQKTAFAAAWTFIAMWSLIRTGTASVTFFRTAGEQGVMTTSGERYPVYDTLKELASHQGRAVQLLTCSNPFVVCGMILDGRKLMMANLTPETLEVWWKGSEYRLQPWEVASLKLDRAEQP